MTLFVNRSLDGTAPADSTAPAAPVTRLPASADGAAAVATEDILQTLRARLESQAVNDLDGGTPEARIYQDRLRHRLTQVKIAQARLHDGTYGTCIDCQQPIEGDRLVTEPFTTRCTRCQMIAEWRGFSY